MTTLASQGTTVKIGNVPIVGVTSIKGPGGSATTIDTSDLSSTAKNKMVGLRDEGQLVLELNFDPGEASHTALNNARATAATSAFEITLKNGDKAAFNGYVQGLEMSLAVDAIVTATCTIEIDGPVTWTYAS